MRKKAIATGLTWMMAIPIIVVFSFLFLSAVLYLNKTTVLFGKADTTIKIPQQTSSNIILETNLQSFLNRKVQFQNQELTILELIENNKLEAGPASDIFNEKAIEQFTALFPFPIKEWDKVYRPPKLHKYDTRQLDIHPYWLSVFDKTEEVISFPGNSKQIFSIGGGENSESSCKPFNDASITLVRFAQNKKIILCIDKSYYKTVEGNR